MKQHLLGGSCLKSELLSTLLAVVRTASRTHLFVAILLDFLELGAVFHSCTHDFGAKLLGVRAGLCLRYLAAGPVSSEPNCLQLHSAYVCSYL